MRAVVFSRVFQNDSLIQTSVALNFYTSSPGDFSFFSESLPVCLVRGLGSELDHRGYSEVSVSSIRPTSPSCLTHESFLSARLGLHMLFFSVCCHRSHTHTHFRLCCSVMSQLSGRDGESFQHRTIQVVRETELTCCLSCH